MKQIGLIILIIVFCFGCTNNFDLENPNVKQFVLQLKNGTYNKYYLGENGEKLWTIFPKFTLKDIPLLIELAKDTTLVNPCGHFPVNSISSIRPYRTDENGNIKGIMLGEYLLWSVETIINNGEFPSLIPALRQENNIQHIGLTGKEILVVREKYLNWWNDCGRTGNISVTPLSGTGYWWR